MLFGNDFFMFVNSTKKIFMEIGTLGKNLKCIFYLIWTRQSLSV